MRQVFSSPRMQNVEGIARFLEEHAIEVRITHGRSYKSAWSGRRTYRDDEAGGPIPAVWVVKSEDQPRARQLLRDAGLLDTTRGGSDSFLAPSMHAGLPEVQPVAPPNKRAFRYKIALLIAIVVAVAFAWNAGRKANTPTTAPVRTAAPAAPRAAAPQAPATPAEPVPNAYPVDTPPALATTLAATELDVHGAGTVCVRIDGAPASADTLAALARPGLKLDCTDAAALTLDVRGYRTDGSGTGTVELAVTSATDGGTPTTQVRTLLVRRREAAWRVLRVLAVR